MNMSPWDGLGNSDEVVGMEHSLFSFSLDLDLDLPEMSIAWIVSMV